MPSYEYRVVPAPTRGKKARGVKRPEMRFSLALQELMNQMGSDGWEYQRAETLPSTERAGLTSTTTEWRNVLVFRRVRAEDVEHEAPTLLPAPEIVPDIESESTEPPVSEASTDPDIPANEEPDKEDQTKT